MNELLIKTEEKMSHCSESGEQRESSSSALPPDDESMNNFDWNENQNCNQQVPYRMFFDTRDKKLQEKIEFVRIVYKYKSQLFGDCDGHDVTPRSKEDAWKKVAHEVELLGLESYKGKNWARLRDHDWQYVRRHALSRNENTSRPIGKLGELDKIVLEIISTTALANAVNQATNSAFFGSQASSSSQQSTDSVEQYLRTFLGSVNQESSETPEIMSASISEDGIISSGSGQQKVIKIEEPMTIQTSNGENNILGILQKVSQTVAHPRISGMSGLSTDGIRAISKSPVSTRKMTNRSATAPSVYAITSSTSPPQASATSGPSNVFGTPPLIKRSKIEMAEERSPTGSIISNYELRKEALLIKKLELECKNTELLNEKLEKEIRIMENQEKRAAELHSIEMRTMKARILRGAAIDETSDY